MLLYPRGVAHTTSRTLEGKHSTGTQPRELMPATYRPERGREVTPKPPDSTVTWDLQPPEPWEDKFLLLKVPGLRYVAKAILED